VGAVVGVGQYSSPSVRLEVTPPAGRAPGRLEGMSASIELGGVDEDMEWWRNVVSPGTGV